MAASTAALAAVGSVKITPTALSSSDAFRTSCVQFAQDRPQVRSVQRLVSTRASLPEEQSVTRRDVLASLLGAGAALGFAEQARASNPGSIARQRKVKKPKSQAKEKTEEVKSSATESATPSHTPPPEVPSDPVEPKLPEVSRLPEPLSTPDVPSISEVPSIPQPRSSPVVPSPPPEAPAPKAEAPNYDEFNLGDYFKDNSSR